MRVLIDSCSNLHWMIGCFWQCLVLSFQRVPKSEDASLLARYFVSILDCFSLKVLVLDGQFKERLCNHKYQSKFLKTPYHILLFQNIEQIDFLAAPYCVYLDCFLTLLLPYCFSQSGSTSVGCYQFVYVLSKCAKHGFAVLIFLNLLRSFRLLSIHSESVLLSLKWLKWLVSYCCAANDFRRVGNFGCFNCGFYHSFLF